MLVLASASPRRQELLRRAAIPFTVDPTDIPEIPEPGEAADAFTQRLARAKARVVASRHPDQYVLGADTTVVVQNEILNKPENGEDARRMLRLLSGRSHQVITGVCLIVPIGGGQQEMSISQQPFNTGNAKVETVLEDVRSEITTVAFSALTDGEIDFYVSTCEPMDKAGAYAIQGIASRWITRIDGDYSNVVGLPVALVYRMLRKHGAVE
jgi:septum formation protein